MNNYGHQVYVRPEEWHRFVEEAQRQRMSMSSWLKACANYCIAIGVDFKEALK